MLVQGLVLVVLVLGTMSADTGTRAVTGAGNETVLGVVLVLVPVVVSILVLVLVPVP